MKGNIIEIVFAELQFKKAYKLKYNICKYKNNFCEAHNSGTGLQKQDACFASNHS